MKVANMRKFGYLLAASTVTILLACSPSADLQQTNQGVSGTTQEMPVEQQETTTGGRYMMRTHNGDIMTDQDFQGKFLLISFGYTSCPDVCPMILAKEASALEMLGDKAERIQVLFVSVDPDRDTPAVLSQYVTSFNPDFIGLSGTKEVTDAMVKSFRAKYEIIGKDGPDDMDYTVDHTATTFLMADDGKYLKRFTFEATAEDMAKAINAIILD